MIFFGTARGYGAQYLNQHPNIKYLDVSDHIIGVKDAKALAAIQTMTTLHVHFKLVGDEGKKARVVPVSLQHYF